MIAIRGGSTGGSSKRKACLRPFQKLNHGPEEYGSGSPNGIRIPCLRALLRT
jgi:hypothetical protein